MPKNVVVIPAEQVHERAGKREKVLRVAAYCRVSTDEENQVYLSFRRSGCYALLRRNAYLFRS